jgi:arsenate reductase
VTAQSAAGDSGEAVLYHHAGCSKSRAALELLVARGIPFRVRDYLDAAPGADELCGLVQALGLPASALVRRDEAAVADLPGDEAADAAWIALLVAQPRLLQRPILRVGRHAVVARPAERVLELLPPVA